jgi:hypothetical protein
MIRLPYKLSSMLACAAFALGAATSAGATTIDLEALGASTITNGRENLITSSIDGYAFNSGVAVVNLLSLSYSTSPAPVSGQYAALNAMGNTASLSRLDGGVFSLASVDFGSAFGYNGAPLETFNVTGYLHGKLVAHASASTINGAWNTLATNFSFIDSVTFSLGGVSTKFVLDNISVAVVPEPETYAMLLVGLGLIGCAARRRT